MCSLPRWIEVHDRQDSYVSSLILAVEPSVTIADLMSELRPMWRLLRATPEQHCKAFIACTQAP